VALTVGALAVGVVLGRLLLQPLRYRHLGAARVRWPVALGLGAVLAVAADRIDGGGAVPLAVVGQVLLIIGVLANLHLVGTGVLAVGLALNLVSMVVDGGVPVRRGALVAAGVLEPADVPDATVSGPRHLERSDDLAPWLGDALPVAPMRTVVSFGDLVVAVGVADVAAHAARRRRTAQVPLSTNARPVHDWGTAPPGAPVSGSHHSARPEVRAPAAVGLARVFTPANQSR
jgi:hypothetical protein